MAISPVTSYSSPPPMAYPQKPAPFPPLVPTGFATTGNSPYGYGPTHHRNGAPPVACVLMAACATVLGFFLVGTAFSLRKMSRMAGRSFPHDWKFPDGSVHWESTLRRTHLAGNPIHDIKAPTGTASLRLARKSAERRMNAMASQHRQILSEMKYNEALHSLDWDAVTVRKTKLYYGRVKAEQQQVRIETAAEYQNLFSRSELERLLDVKLPKKLPRYYG